LSIEGKWELEASFNGMTGGKSDYPPGNGKILKFGKTNYEILDKGQVVKSGIYRVVSEVSILTKLSGNRIIYDDETDSVRTFIEIKDGKLSYFIDAYDAGSAIYTRIGDN
jgi:hypothetical protein